MSPRIIALCTTLALASTLPACAHKQWDQALAGERSILIEPGEGLGNLHLGSRQGRVRRRLGEPSGIDAFADGELYWTYRELGLSVQFVDDRVHSLFCYSGVHGGYETRDYDPFPGATAEGITVHDLKRPVLEAYGRPDKREGDPHAPIPAEWLTYDQGLGFCFVAATDRMVYLYVQEQ